MWNGRHSSMGVKGRRCSTLAIGDEWSAMQKHEELCLAWWHWGRRQLHSLWSNHEYLDAVHGVSQTPPAQLPPPDSCSCFRSL